MPMVRAKVDCFIDKALRKAGEEFEYNGPAFKHVEPLTPKPAAKPASDWKPRGRPAKASK